MPLTSKVPGNLGGQSILSYLAGRFTYLSEDAWRELIEEGRVLLRGAQCSPESPVAAGDPVTCNLPPVPTPKVNLDYRIIYEDQYLLAVNKPPGLRVHSGGKFARANLIHHLRHLRDPPYPEVNLVNRLDAGTSGLILLAQDKGALRDLMGQFSAGEVEKVYLALVEGLPEPAEGVIDLPIGPVADAKVPRYGVDHEHGKEAVTYYRTLQVLANGTALVELNPQTGRTHQLRVHMAAIGHPLVGDALYTMDDDAFLEYCSKDDPEPVGGLMRPALHSYRLRFRHPVEGRLVTLEAPLADDLVEFLTAQGGTVPTSMEDL